MVSTTVSHRLALRVSPRRNTPNNTAAIGSTTTMVGTDVCSDPAWNAEYCRNRRNFLDDITRRAIASDQDAMLATYGMELGQGRYLAVKNVFVPLRIRNRRWGNFELAYRDE